MSQCRGKTRFEQFKKGLARNDMIKEIQKCDRQMNRMFDRFMVSIFFWIHAQSCLNSHQAAMLMDIRFQQLVAERAQSAPTPMHMSMPIPSVTIEEPQPTRPRSISFPQPQVCEPVAQTPSVHARSISSGSNPVPFVPPTSQFFLSSDTAQIFPRTFVDSPASSVRSSSTDAYPARAFDISQLQPSPVRASHFALLSLL